jgi:hypothetical protein
MPRVGLESNMDCDNQLIADAGIAERVKLIPPRGVLSI